MSRRIDEALTKAGLPPLTRSAWVEVDVDVLTANAAALVGLVAPAQVGAVVKADGYGHGLEMAARCAVSGGAVWLCVADAGEAMRLRDDGYQGRIMVQYPLPSVMAPVMARHGVDVTVGSREDVSAIVSRLDSGDRPLNVHLEVDTGMSRGGVAPESAREVAGVITDHETMRLAGVWTHLAAPDHAPVTREQVRRFDVVLNEIREAGLEPEVIHVAASGGILAIDTSGHTLVRPGLAYYGVHPRAGDPLPETVTPALTVKAHPVRVTTVGSGTAVGYAGTWVAKRESRIATLPIGYADGWARASSPGTRVMVNGREAPLVGRISSDSLTVDVTDLPDVGPDTEFTLLGSGITADEIADVRGTISWEVLQQLGARLSRVYVSGERVVATRAESSTVLTLTTDAPGYGVRSEPADG